MRGFGAFARCAICRGANRLRSSRSTFRWKCKNRRQTRPCRRTLTVLSAVAFASPFALEAIGGSSNPPGYNPREHFSRSPITRRRSARRLTRAGSHRRKVLCQSIGFPGSKNIAPRVPENMTTGLAGLDDGKDTSRGVCDHRPSARSEDRPAYGRESGPPPTPQFDARRAMSAESRAQVPLDRPRFLCANL